MYGQKMLLGLCFMALLVSATAQTNTFPASGNVGIGTLSPITMLDVTGTQTNQNSGGGDYLLNYGLGRSLEDPNSGDIILLVPASTGTAINGSQFAGIIESNRGSAGSWNLNSQWYVSVQSAYTNNTGSITPLSGQQEYASIPTLITCVYNGTTYIGFQTPTGNSSSIWSLAGNWSNNQNSQKPVMVAKSSVTNISTFVGYESLGSQISMTGIGSSGYVGIGTKNPAYSLDVAGQIRSSVGGIVFPDGSVQATAFNPVGAGSGSAIAETNGNVGIGIGTSTPGQLLQVGSAYSQNPSIMIGGHDSNNSNQGSESLLFGAWRDVEPTVTSGIVATPTWTCCGGYPASGYAGIRENKLGFYTIYDPASPSNYSPNMLINTDGNIGIGTTTPNYSLDVGGQIHSSTGIVFPDGSTQMTAYNPSLSLSIGGSVNSSSNLSSTISGDVGGAVYLFNPTKTTAGTASRWSIYNMTGAYGNSLQFWAYDNLGCVTGGLCASRLSLMDNGNVGIGTTAPSAKLEVSGSLKLTSGSGGSITFQDGTTQSTAWTGMVCGGDYAELVDVTGDRKKYEPGDVLVIDPDAPGKFLKSAEPYSTAVTGVYSTKPGTVGRRQATPKGPDEVPMAMVGIVPVKVSAENGAIRPGDLLVTSSKLGFAMKGTDHGRFVGAVIGKALGNLNSGTGVIEVVVTLQ